MALDREDLAELNEIFNDMGGVAHVEDFTNSYEELPDGTYEGEILNVESKNSKNTGRPMLDLSLGLTQDRKEHIYLPLAGKDLAGTRTAIARAIKQLTELGVTGTTVEDFISNSVSLVGTRISLKITTSGNYKNRWLTRV